MNLAKEHGRILSVSAIGKHLRKTPQTFIGIQHPKSTWYVDVKSFKEWVNAPYKSRGKDRGKRKLKGENTLDKINENTGPSLGTARESTLGTNNDRPQEETKGERAGSSRPE